MKVVGLVSGGKDSCYNMVQCIQQGHKIVALANLRPKDKDELDSYMYQTVGHHAIELYAEAMGVPLYRRTIQGSSLVQSKLYVTNAEDEVEDLYELLKTIKDEVSVHAVSVGAILSDYQRIRVEHVCARLGLTCLSYLWRRDQKDLLEEMIGANIQAIIIKVAALGLNPTKHLGMSISQIFPEMCKLHSKYGLNICGEGGEYETFTLDCPLFVKRIVIDDYEVVTHSDDAFAPVGFLHFKSMHLEDKEETLDSRIEDRIRCIPVCFEGDPVVPLSADVRDGPDAVDNTREEQTPAVNLLQVPETENQVKEIACGVRRCGNYLWVGDILGYSVDGQNIGEVTKHVMDELSEKLEKGGSSLSQALLIHLAVRNMDVFSGVNCIYNKYFQFNPPARVCIQLDLPEGVLLQLDCLACISGSEDLSCQHHRETMHVQSISHWAPANIGPYSQAVKLRSVTYVSGCIALRPATMSIINGGIGIQSALSLRHVDRVLSAFTPGSSLANILQGICYVTSSSSIPVARASWRNAWNAKITSSFQDVTSEESMPCRGLMSYVVVPALPRDALVEWHVISQNYPLDWKYAEEVAKREEFQLHYKRIWSPGDKCCVVNCSVEREVGLKNCSVVQLQDVMETFVGELKDVLSNCNMAFKDVITARIFYCNSATYAPSSTLRMAVEKFFRNEELAEHSFALLPVDGLERSALVCFCFYLQKT